MFSGRCSRICECRNHRLRTYYSFVPSLYVSYYRAQTKLREGNVFTPVCQPFCSQGVGVSASLGVSTSGGEGCLHPGGGLHPRGICIQKGERRCLHLGRSASRWGKLGNPSPLDTTGHGQRAGGTHPTGMYSCSKILSLTTLG